MLTWISCPAAVPPKYLVLQVASAMLSAAAVSAAAERQKREVEQERKDLLVQMQRQQQQQGQQKQETLEAAATGHNQVPPVAQPAGAEVVEVSILSGELEAQGPTDAPADVSMLEEGSRSADLSALPDLAAAYYAPLSATRVAPARGQGEPSGMDMSTMSSIPAGELDAALGSHLPAEESHLSLEDTVDLSSRCGGGNA